MSSATLLRDPGMRAQSSSEPSGSYRHHRANKKDLHFEFDETARSRSSWAASRPKHPC